MGAMFKSPDTPEPPPPPPPEPEEAQPPERGDPEVEGARRTERARARFRRGRQSTILTSAQGLESEQTTGQTVLGR